MDLAALARSFALVRLPKMSELKNKKLEYEEYPIDVNAIPYRDPVREKARQERLKKEAEAKQAKQDSPKAGKPSRRNEKRDHAEEEKEKKKKGRHERIMDEWEELQEEERLFKMMKKKQIT